MAGEGGGERQGSMEGTWGGEGPLCSLSEERMRITSGVHDQKVDDSVSALFRCFSLQLQIASPDPTMDSPSGRGSGPA